MRPIPLLAVLLLAGPACRSDFRADVPTEPPPLAPAQAVTGGGGTASSERFTVRLSVGAPAATGTSSSEARRVQAGPLPTSR